MLVFPIPSFLLTPNLRQKKNYEKSEILNSEVRLFIKDFWIFPSPSGVKTVISGLLASSGMALESHVSHSTLTV